MTAQTNKYMSVPTLVAAAGLAAAMICCGPDASKATPLRTDHCPVGGCVDASVFDAGPIVIAPEPLEPWDTTNEGPLSGIFAVEATIDARVVVPVRLKQLLRLRIVQQGTSVHEKSTLCAFKLPVVQDVASLEIPPLLQQVIATKSTEDQGQYLSSDAVVNAVYSPPPFLVVVGANLQNPATDPLPSMTDLTNAVDEDHDGNPGVTLLANVLTCTEQQNLYVALRVTGNLTGTVLTPDVITGKVDIGFTESILGYSDDCLSTAAQIQIVITPGSPFRAERTSSADDIDGNGNVSCPELVAHATDLFPDWNDLTPGD
ncbi:MAG: hypothetical protein ACRELY_28360 [Polyangiaceae bacterium]